ncbi:MAG: hypothetical protein ABIA93_05500 [Candidatus Woesearchaeota archaeon]
MSEVPQSFSAIDKRPVFLSIPEDALKGKGYVDAEAFDNISDQRGHTYLAQTLRLIRQERRFPTVDEIVQRVSPNAKAEFSFVTVMGGFPIILPFINGGDESTSRLATNYAVEFRPPEEGKGWISRQRARSYWNGIVKDPSMGKLPLRRKEMPVLTLQHDDITYSTSFDYERMGEFECSVNNRQSDRRFSFIYKATIRNGEVSQFSLGIELAEGPMPESTQEEIHITFEESKDTSLEYALDAWTFRRAARFFNNGAPGTATLKEQTNVLRSEGEDDTYRPVFKNMLAHDQPSLFDAIASNGRRTPDLNYENTLEGLALLVRAEIARLRGNEKGVVLSPSQQDCVENYAQTATNLRDKGLRSFLRYD